MSAVIQKGNDKEAKQLPEKPKFIVTYAPREKPSTLDDTVRGILGISLDKFIDEILRPDGKYHGICKRAGKGASTP